MKQKNKSYRFYESDHIWIKKQAVLRHTTFLKILTEVCFIHDRFSHYFEDKHGLMSARPDKPVELTGMLKVNAKAYSAPGDMILWLEQFFYDEITLMDNPKCRSLLIHLLLCQYKEFLTSRVLILDWYKNNMPHIDVEVGE